MLGNTTSMKVPRKLKPYFEFAYVFGFPLCDCCGAEPVVVSDSPRHSNPWYLDAAAAYASAQVTLKSDDRPWMLVSTTRCVDT